MANIYHDPEKLSEMLDARIDERTRQIHVYIAVALGLVKEINNNFSILASKLGLQSALTGIIDIDNIAVKHQNDNETEIREICEKINGFTHTITGLSNILRKLPTNCTTNSSDITSSSIALQEHIIALKASYERMNSLAKRFKTDTGCGYRSPQTRIVPSLPTATV